MCIVTQRKHTVPNDEVKCGGLVIKQARQQDSAVKKTRVRRSKVGDGEVGGGQQREPADSKIWWWPSPSARVDTWEDIVLGEKDSPPVGLPVGHLTSDPVDDSIVAAKQWWFSSSPANLVSALKHSLDMAWQHRPLPSNSHHCLRGTRRNTSCNGHALIFINGNILFTDPFFSLCTDRVESDLNWFGLKEQRIWANKLFQSIFRGSDALWHLATLNAT